MRLSTQVLSVLSDAVTQGNKLILQGQLDRNLYTATNSALEAAGGKWNRKEKAHIFESDASDRIEQMILTGEVEVPKDDYDFFPTPAFLVERLIAHSGISAGDKVLEPSAGRGAIALACASFGASVDCIEKMPSNFEHLNSLTGLSSVTQGDFLDVEPSPIYDAILMNPPFSKRAEIHHVNHALKFLKDGGVLVSVMSSGITFRSDKITTALREYVEKNGFIEPIEQGAFKESGTMVNTVFVVVAKPAGNGILGESP